MTDPAEVRRLLERLAVHPVLPPAETLPAHDETFHALVADLARGARSTHAALLREVAEATGLAAEELARRAQFLLACLLIPASGTHYEVLGVPPTATAREIRKRWAALIQRYHPDRLGGGDWLEGQARRLIEAYQTLKDPERRREYDAELARSRPAAPRRSGPPRLRLHLGPVRWRWVPVGITAAGVVIVVWAATRPAPPPLPRADLPTAPKLIESWDPVPGAPERSERPPRPEPRVTAPTPPTAEQGPATAPREIPLLSLLREYRSRGSEPREAPITPPAEEPAPAATPQPPMEPPPPPTPESTASPGPPAADAPASESHPLPAPTPPTPIVPSPEAAAIPSVERSPAPSPPPPRAVAPPPEPAPPPPTPPAAVVAPPSSPTNEPAPVAGQVASRSIPEGPSNTEIFAVIDRFRQAYERKDLGAVMEFFGSEPRDLEVRGRAAVEKLYAANFSSLREIRYQLTQLQVQQPPADGHVVVEGRFRIRAARKGWLFTQAVDVSGPIRWTLRREAGHLRIVAIDYEPTE